VVAGTEVRELGYDPRDTLTYTVAFAGAGFAAPGQRVAAQHALLERIAALPGVRSVSFATDGSWLGMGTEDRVSAICGNCFRGSMWLPVTRGPARHHVVSPGYFEALGIPLLRGRTLSADDAAGAPVVAVISDAFAHLIFLGQDPIGKAVQVGGPDGEWYTVVGVVGSVRARGLGSSSEPVPSMYLSSLQHPPSSLGLAVRTAGEPHSHAAAVEEAIRAAAPAVAVHDAMTMEERLSHFVAPLRWFAGIFTGLAAFAGLLAGLGLFGVVAFTVARRTREMGVRIALGARGRQVATMIVGQSLRLAGVGAWLGVLAALCLARLLQFLFLGVAPLDWAVYATVVGLLLVVATVASYLPARRAARVDPVIALRAE
jgi:putative ABC transport system permease protein